MYTKGRDVIYYPQPLVVGSQESLIGVEPPGSVFLYLVYSSIIPNNRSKNNYSVLKADAC